MSKHPTLTYGQLFNKLHELGFQECRVELDGKRGLVFENKTIAGSMITLPEGKPNDPVEPSYAQKVLALLRRHNLLPETTPLLLAYLAGTNTERSHED